MHAKDKCPIQFCQGGTIFKLLGVPLHYVILNNLPPKFLTTRTLSNGSNNTFTLKTTQVHKHITRFWALSQ